MSDWWTACSFSGGRHMLMSLAVLFCKYLRLPATTVSCEWLVFTLGENFQRKLAPMTLPVPVIPVGQLIVKSTKSMVQTIYLNSHQSLSFQVELSIKTKIWVNLCYNFLPTYVGYTVSSLRFKWLTQCVQHGRQVQTSSRSHRQTKATESFTHILNDFMLQLSTITRINMMKHFYLTTLGHLNILTWGEWPGSIVLQSALLKRQLTAV